MVSGLSDEVKLLGQEVTSMALPTILFAVFPELAILDEVASRLVSGSGVPPELASAMPRMTARIEANPRDAEAWLLRGAVLRGLGRATEARSDLEEAVHLRPHDGRAWLLLSEVLAGQGEHDLARAARLRGSGATS